LNSVTDTKVIILILESLRPKQWTKNLFIFSALVFSVNLFNVQLLVKDTLAFVIFCLLSGLVYIFNDIIDKEKDKYHALKSRRPIASGRLKSTHAGAFIGFFLPILLGMSFYLDLSFFLVVLLYLLLQVVYTFHLKHVLILDVFSVAFSFVLRVVAGAVVIDVEMSSWLLICTSLLALFLGLSKRRHESLLLEDKAQHHRKVLKEYNPYLLDQMISVVTASTLIAYCLYTISEETVRGLGNPRLFTIPFVLYGIFRYLFLIHNKGEGGIPENLIVTDKPLLINIFLWIITIIIIFYMS
jgi:4-hydroxybenzoate polyprenyltransferase